MKIHWNLNKKCWSLGSPVIHIFDSIILKEVTFKVSLAGRLRCLKEKRRNVHAWALGEICGHKFNSVREITYNPYKFEYFYYKDSLEPIYQIEYALFRKNGKVYV